ncbi:xanthine dehydrogenase accessory protein XdhC [Azospirillum picis]|uniref:Xanthine dehydrogenase accessory protein XdhC n=1 Tax=Azospirillum picis TaxID=488438 RepID=A0ABU0MIC8_9PROT|nr:xanthine dehydrogenase accessory protein XdhC [Azospirillum picis]MBP2299353.1 xanthine dehydrogenase accessory protein XdhC [Azospirillum picis]MDQ0533009.1 xanthine dehydrogenase accessory protein XdhC [Azospirillum picis]
MIPLSTTLADRLALDQPTVLVTVAEARGSTPREEGAGMLVGRDSCAGTVGGGRLEWTAIAAARRMLEDGSALETLDLPLGPATGQCCGGHVVLRLERAAAATVATLQERERRAADACPTLLLFGAGHVGRAMVAAFAPLPLRLWWIDSRAEEFPAALPPGVERVLTDSPLDPLAAAPAGTGYLVLTHSHALDFEITEAALRRGDAAYVGMIGSATKRAKFERWFRARGRGEAALAGLTCPIGAALTSDKRPEVIAALAAAELLVAFTTHRATAALPK